MTFISALNCFSWASLVCDSNRLNQKIEVTAVVSCNARSKIRTAFFIISNSVGFYGFGSWVVCLPIRFEPITHEFFFFASALGFQAKHLNFARYSGFVVGIHDVLFGYLSWDL